jgi:hypothetical protein
MRNYLTLLLTVASLAACGGEQASAEQTTSWPSFDQPSAAVKPKSTNAKPLPNACALVSAAQAQVVLAQNVSPMNDEPENCIWVSSDSPGSITMLMVQVSDNEDEEMAQQVFNGITGLQGNLNELVNQNVGAKTKKSGQELDQLGDEAWLSASNADLIGAQQLVVRKGTRLLTLNVTGMGKTDGLAQRMEALARSAEPKL